jgi:hypothetical protein
MYEKGIDLQKKFKKIFSDNYLKGLVYQLNFLHCKPLDPSVPSNQYA